MVAEQFSVNLVTLFSLNSNCKVKLISTTVLTHLSRSKVRSCVNYSGLKWAPDFIFLCSKITMDGDCSREIKSCLLLGRKAMTNLDILLKSRDITLPTKVRLVKAKVFPIIMYGCESWTIKKAEHWRIDAFELCVGEDSWESLGLQGDPTSPFWRRSALGFLWKEWC